MPSCTLVFATSGLDNFKVFGSLSLHEVRNVFLIQCLLHAKCVYLTIRLWRPIYYPLLQEPKWFLPFFHLHHAPHLAVLTHLFTIFFLTIYLEKAQADIITHITSNQAQAHIYHYSYHLAS